MPHNAAGLLPKQQAFVEAYSAEPHAKNAAIKAGYSPKSSRQQAAFLLTHPPVIEALRSRKQKALARLEVSEDMVLQELAAIAFSNLEDFVTWDESAGSLVVKPSAEIPRHLKAALESIEDQVMRTTNKDGTRSYERHKQRVKLYPKLEALKVLAEYLGLTDSMAPKVAVFIKTGIQRQLPEPSDK